MNYASLLKDMIDDIQKQLDTCVDNHIANGGHMISVKSDPTFKDLAAKKKALLDALNLF